VVGFPVSMQAKGGKTYGPERGGGSDWKNGL